MGFNIKYYMDTHQPHALHSLVGQLVEEQIYQLCQSLALKKPMSTIVMYVKIRGRDHCLFKQGFGSIDQTIAMCCACQPQPFGPCPITLIVDKLKPTSPSTVAAFLTLQRSSHIGIAHAGDFSRA